MTTPRNLAFAILAVSRRCQLASTYELCGWSAQAQGSPRVSIGGDVRIVSMSNEADPIGTRQPSSVVFNDLTAAVDALSLCADMLEDSEANPQRLRWAIIASHQAAQCWMIRALSRNGEARVLNAKRKDVKEYLQALHDYPMTGKYPNAPTRALLSFEKLYKKVQDPSPAGIGQMMNSLAFEPDSDTDRYIRDLNTFRNEFIHFGPGYWILESCWDSNNVLWYPLELQAEANDLVDRAAAAIERLKAHYCEAD